MEDMAASSNVPPSGKAVGASPRGSGDKEELLVRSGQGDRAAFAELYDATSNRLFGLVLSVTRDVETSEEVARAAYLQVWRQSARYDRDRGSALGWIMTIAHRAAVDRLTRGVSPQGPSPTGRADKRS
jgi:RNA polymerase sigma-70 factor (ECF subfamily)